MISDFTQLSEKITLLADLTATLRRENAALRVQAVSLGVQNADLQQRMALAHERVTALLQRLPVDIIEAVDVAAPAVQSLDAEESL
ncbi:MAG: DUF904 domain-containing protein [Pseudomonadota bacterium]|nr:DUF904 domain-containing protein [Pseudomonadota bacterium]